MKHNLVDSGPTARIEAIQTAYVSHLDESLLAMGSQVINNDDGIIRRRNSCKCFVTLTGVGEMTCIV